MSRVAPAWSTRRTATAAHGSCTAARNTEGPPERALGASFAPSRGRGAAGCAAYAVQGTALPMAPEVIAVPPADEPVSWNVLPPLLMRM